MGRCACVTAASAFSPPCWGDAAATGPVRPALPPGLPVAGEKPPHPLSLKDLSWPGPWVNWRRWGVACLKIEGRMKRPEYVAGSPASTPPPCARGGAHPGGAGSAGGRFSRQGFTQGISGTRRGRPCSAPVPRGQDPADLFDQAGGSTPGESTGRFPCLSPPRSRETPMVLTARDGGPYRCRQGPCPQAARTRQTTADQVVGQLRKTGGTVYQAHQVQVDPAPRLSVPPCRR